ncbi:MAG: DUF1385 domain-containing protein [Candidatus Altimarinota bacterium]
MNSATPQNSASQPTPKFDFAVGGQAVIEGVMMRSANYTIVSVRRQDGQIISNQEFYQNLSRRFKLLGLPLVRGVVNLFEMMFIGTKALSFSSKQFMADLEEEIDKSPEAKSAQKTQTAEKSSWKENLSLIATIAFSLGLSIFLFKFLPLWVTTFLSDNFTAVSSNYIIFNLIDGILKTSFFILYIWLISLMPDLYRVFQYHGAEHKSIMTYEAGKELTVENARLQTRFHPRCGTSFILVVFLISIMVYTVVPRHPDFWINFAIRLIFLPIIAAFSYEFLKFSAKSKSPAVGLLAKPGLLMQRLTTKEPDDQMLAVALNSLKLALEMETKSKLNVIK